MGEDSDTTQSSDEEGSDKEGSDEEGSDKEGSGEEGSDKEGSAQDNAEAESTEPETEQAAETGSGDGQAGDGDDGDGDDGDGDDGDGGASGMAELDEQDVEEIAKERDRRLDPDNRPDNTEVDNTDRTFDAEAGTFTDADEFDENNKPFPPVEEQGT